MTCALSTLPPQSRVGVPFGILTSGPAATTFPPSMTTMPLSITWPLLETTLALAIANMSSPSVELHNGMGLGLSNCVSRGGSTNPVLVGGQTLGNYGLPLTQ